MPSLARVVTPAVVGALLLAGCSADVATQPRPPQPVDPPAVVPVTPRSVGPPTAVFSFATQPFVLAGDPAPIEATVFIVDAAINGVPGVPATFTVVKGDGVLTRTAATSDQGGYARAGVWSIGADPQEHAVRVTVLGLPDSEISFETVRDPGDLGSTTYAMVATDGVPLAIPVDVGLATPDTLVGATLNFRGAQVEVLYTYRRRGVEVVDRRNVTYVKRGIDITFPGLRAFAMVSADGRLKLAPDGDDWPMVSGSWNDFVRVP